MTNLEADHLADNLANWRTLRGWSQYRLAAESGVARSVIVRVEKGGHAATLSTIQRLAAALGTEAATLLSPPKVRRQRAAG